MTFDSKEKSGKGSFVRSSFRAAGKLTNTIAGPLGNTDNRCCKCRFTIKHTSATIAFHKQQWLPSKVAAIWQRKGKTHQIRNARDFVSNPADPYQGTVHFFNPAERTYEYVLFETGFTLKTSSDQFVKKPWKISLYGMNESAPKQKQVKALGSAEVELSPYAFEAFTSPRTVTSAGTTSSSASSSSDSASSRLLRVELEPKSEKVKTASLDIEISCAILSDDFLIDDDEFSDAASTSCGGSTNEGDLASITGSDLFGPLDTSSSSMSQYGTVSPMVNARLTRMQTLSSSDLKQKGENSGTKLSKRFSFSSRSFKTKRNVPGADSSSLYPPPHLLRAANDRNDKHRTASLSPAKDNRIHYHLPPLSTSSQEQKRSEDTLVNDTAADGTDCQASLSQAAKNRRVRGATVMGITLEEKRNSTSDSFEESFLKTPINPDSATEEAVCNGKSPTSPSVIDTGTLKQISPTKEDNVPVNCFTPQSRNLPSVILESPAESQPENELLECEPIVLAPETTDQNGVFDSNGASVHLNHSESDQPPLEALEEKKPESPKEVKTEYLSFPITGAAKEESSAAGVNENHEVKDHPLSPKMDEVPGQTNFNPFLCDNAEDTPFTSAEMIKEKLDAEELTKQRDFESWVAEVVKGYPRVGQSGAYIMTGSMSGSSDEVTSEEDQISMQLTCGITLCAVLHRFNPQLIGNFNWLLEENDTESDRYFKLALSTCDIVDIPVKDCTSKDTFEIFKRIYAKYEKQPVPAMPNLGDLGFTEQIELDELERNESIRRKVRERSTTKDATNKRMSKFAKRTTTVTIQPAETVEAVASVNVELQPTSSGSNNNSNGIDNQVAADSQKSISNSKSFPTIGSTTTSVPSTIRSESTKNASQQRLAQNTSKIESAKSLMSLWGSKLKTKIEESSPVRSSNFFTNLQQSQTQQQSQHQQQPIVMLDESDLGAHNGEVAAGSAQPPVVNSSSAMTENGATNLVEYEETKDGASPPGADNSVGAYFESEQVMCDTLRRNWRKMVASKRDVLKNRVAEIDVELTKIRNEMMELTKEDDILSSSKEMANLTNEKSELILEFDDIEIMEEDLDLQEKCDQIKTQLQLLQLNTEVSGTAEKEAEEKRLLQIFYKYMDERNELVEKVDNRKREQSDLNNGSDSDSKQYFSKISDWFVSRSF